MRRPYTSPTPMMDLNGREIVPGTQGSASDLVLHDIIR
jgi:hypothetical protein